MTLLLAHADGPAVAPDAATAHHQSVAQAHASALASSRRYLLGLVLLLAVVFLWVASSALIQSIFVDQNFHRPFMLTYYSTSLFTLYLPLWAARQWIAKRGWCSGGSERARMRRAAVLLDATAAPDSSSHAAIARAESASTNETVHASAKPQRSPVLFDTHQLGRGASGEPLAISPRLIDVEAADVVGSPGGAAGTVESECEGGSGSGGPHWSVMATARLSLLLCPIWFGMNFFFNLSLGLTSIASSTILATTSSLWVLAFTRLLDPRETVRAQQLLGVCATILGAVLISWKDTGMQSAGAGAAGGTVADPNAPASPSHHLAGDVLAALSAVCYGLYSVQLRLRIPDESLVDMQLVFGFLGLANMALTWPCFFLLHATGVEEWQGLPSAGVMAFLTLNGILGTVVSDFLWAKSVLLTSPLVASLGLALTVPLAITLDWAFHDAAFTPMYILGGLCVLAGFALVNLAHSRRLEERAVAEEEAAEIEEEQGQLHQRQHEHEHEHEHPSSQLQLDLDSASSFSSSSRAGSDHIDLASSPDSQRHMIDKQKHSNGDGAHVTSRPVVPLQRSDSPVAHSQIPTTSGPDRTAPDALADEFHLELVPIRLESEEAEGGAEESDRADDDADLQRDQAPPAAYF